MDCAVKKKGGVRRWEWGKRIREAIAAGDTTAPPFRKARLRLKEKAGRKKNLGRSEGRKRSEVPTVRGKGQTTARISALRDFNVGKWGAQDRSLVG